MITSEQLEQLQTFADLEGSEVGEVLQLLLDIQSGYSDYISPHLEEVLEKQLLMFYQDFMENFEVVEHEEIFKRTVKSLEMR